MKKKVKNNLTRVVGGKRHLTLTGRKAVTGLKFISPLLIGLIFFFGVPLIQSFIFSISEIKTNSGGYTVDYTGFDNYKNKRGILLEIFRITTNRILLNINVWKCRYQSVNYTP